MNVAEALTREFRAFVEFVVTRQLQLLRAVLPFTPPLRRAAHQPFGADTEARPYANRLTQPYCFRLSFANASYLSVGENRIEYFQLREHSCIGVATGDKQP